MQGEDSLHAFIIYDSPDGEGLVDTAAFAGYYRAAKYLKTLSVAFFDSAVHIHRIAYFEMRNLFLKAFAFDSVQKLCFHQVFSFSR